MRAARVTIDDVAGAAGVHPSTVSRALSKPEVLSPATREKVLATARRLGYVPDRAARSLAQGRSSSLGLVVPDIVNPFFAAIVRAIQREARVADHAVFLADSGQDREEEMALAEWLGAQVDALIICVPVGDAGRLAARIEPTPLIIINGGGERDNRLLIDQAQVLRMACRHLRELGHRRIGVVGGPAHYWSARQREQARLELRGRPRHLGRWEPTFEGGRLAAAAVASAKVTGVVTFNDLQALGLIAGLAEHGLSVPHDVSVVGSDDIPMASLSSPPLTTVVAPLDALGRSAARTAFRLLGVGTVDTAELNLTTELVVRASTATVT